MKITKRGILFLTMLPIIMIMFALPGAALAASVLLEWDPSTDADLAGYNIYYQANSSAQPFRGTGAAAGSAPIDAANTTTAIIDGLDPANSYFFSVTAYNSASLESVYSNIIQIPESAPPVVTISSPANNASVSGTVSISATASDNVGVTGVQFYLNGVLQATDTTAPYLFNWDTSSLAAGAYTVSARASDLAGNLGQSEVVVTVAGDTSPPTVYFSAPGNNASVSGSVTVTVTASDDVAVTRVEVYDNGVLAFASNQNPASFSWNTLLAANGSHTLSARAYDAAGNVGRSADTVVSVVNDSSAPSVALSPVNGSTVGGLVSVTADATDNVGVTRVEFYLNGYLKSTATKAPFTYSWNTAVVGNGASTLSAKAYDAAGNVGQSANVAVTVFNDKTAPGISIGSPVNGSTVGGTVAVSAASSDNVGVTRVEFYVNGALKATSTSAPYGFDWNTMVVANGSYTLSAKAYDAAGNIGRSADTAVSVVNDSGAPSVALRSPVNGSTVGGLVSVTADATDNVGVTRVEFYLNGYRKSTSTRRPFTFSWNTALVGNGAFTLSARAYDASGNVGQSANVAVTVFNDKTAPSVSIGSPVNGSTVRGTVAVSAVSSDNVGVTKVEFYVNGALQSTATSTPYSFNWNTVAVVNGAYTLSAKAYDAAGNIRQSAKVALNVFNDTKP